MANRNRDKGAEWELIVKKDLEGINFFVSKFHSNVNLETNKLIGARPGPFRIMQTGFPDFMCWSRVPNTDTYLVSAVECKINGELSVLEKYKCLWLIRNKIFSSILIAHKTKKKNRIKIVYDNFEIRYKKWITKNEKNK